VLGRSLAVDDGLAALEGEVTVKLEHGGAWRDQFGTVHLNLIAPLGVQSGGNGSKGSEQQNRG
jgi:hypothetical protein